MKRLTIVVTAVLWMVIVAAASHSGETGSDTTSVDKKKLTLQTHCPIMGGEIDSTVYADIQGQRIYFCCPGCIETFKKDPDKYFKKAAEEGIMFENIQTRCPVSGNPINERFFVYYEGRGIYFCCENCINDFHKDPEKYLKKLDEMTGEHEEKKEAHGEDHEHKH